MAGLSDGAKNAPKDEKLSISERKWREENGEQSWTKLYGGPVKGVGHQSDMKYGPKCRSTPICPRHGD